MIIVENLRNKKSMELTIGFDGMIDSNFGKIVSSLTNLSFLNNK